VNKSKFYNFYQKRPLGNECYIDNKLCYLIVIEANNYNEANKIAENLGCCWKESNKNGVYWDKYINENFEGSCRNINLNWIKKYGHEVFTSELDDNPEQLWKNRYNKYSIFEFPKWKKNIVSNLITFRGKIYFKSIEEYIEVLSMNSSSFIKSHPYARIFYKNGDIKEYFSEK
jgi:hypothetical protein